MLNPLNPLMQPNCKSNTFFLPKVVVFPPQSKYTTALVAVFHLLYNVAVVSPSIRQLCSLIWGIAHPRGRPRRSSPAKSVVGGRPRSLSAAAFLPSSRNRLRDAGLPLMAFLAPHYARLCPARAGHTPVLAFAAACYELRLSLSLATRGAGNRPTPDLAAPHAADGLDWGAFAAPFLPRSSLRS